MIRPRNHAFLDIEEVVLRRSLRSELLALDGVDVAAGQRAMVSGRRQETTLAPGGHAGLHLVLPLSLEGDPEIDASPFYSLPRSRVRPRCCVG